jgi:isochorismate synthase EntC
VSTTEPRFVLCGPRGTLVGSGVQTRYCNVQAAPRSGSAPIPLGALPFDMGAPVALLVPNTVLRTDGPPDWPMGPLPAVRVVAAVPASYGDLVPTKAASELIAGAVGWCDASGDGHWVVSIRCTQLSAGRRTTVAHAGGIIAESDPDDEVDKTTTKFATIFNALGVDQ